MKWLVIIFVFLSLTSTADNFLQDRQDLQRLLAERAARFNVYTESLKKRSGFFGNKTKHDMEKSNEVLMQIVNTDNKIIDVLNRFLNYKTFEKTNISYDAEKSKEKVQQMMQLTDTLTKELNRLESENKQLTSRNIKLKGWGFLSLAALVAAIYFLFRRRKLPTNN
jgi:hypothetical protein